MILYTIINKLNNKKEAKINYSFFCNKQLRLITLFPRLIDPKVFQSFDLNLG